MSAEMTAPPHVLGLGLGLGPGQREVRLTDAAGAAVLGVLDLTALERVVGAMPRVFGAVRPGDIGSLAGAERQAAVWLSLLFEGLPMAPVRKALALVGQAAQAEGRRVVLAVELGHPATLGLPWELLTGLAQHPSPLAGVGICRVQPGAAARSGDVVGVPEARLRTWSPDPDATLAAAHREFVHGLMDHHLAIQLEALDTDLPAVPADPGARLHVLHLVLQGAAGVRALAARVKGSGADATIPHHRALRTLVRQADLVVADVIDAPDAPALPPGATGKGLLKAGARAVLAPRTHLDLASSQAFYTAFYQGLGDGLDLVGAVDLGRQALTARAAVDPSARPWNPQVRVRGQDSLSMPRLAPPPRVPGWALSDPALFPLVRRVGLRAEVAGWWGAEHLLMSLLEEALDISAELGAALRAALPEQAGLRRAEGPVEASPRVRFMARVMEPGWDQKGLLAALAGVPWVSDALPAADAAKLRLMGSGPRPEAGRPVMHRGRLPGGRGVVLEVEQGPEDGRVLHLDAPGVFLGRWDPSLPLDEPLALYRDLGAADPGLSRRHMQWRGAKALDLRESGRLLRAGGRPSDVKGGVQVDVGDRLAVGLGTVLLVRKV